jgi:hypothetical protein
MDLIEQIITSKMRKYKDHLNAVQQRKEAAVEKQALVEKSIRDRHATLVAAADKARDEALETLKAESARLDQDYKKEMDDYTQSPKFESACYFQCKLTNVSVKSIATVGKIAEDLQLDLEMDEFKLRGELGKKFPDDKDVGIVRSVTHRPPKDDTISTLVKNARSFMGSVVATNLKVTSQPQVHVVERFTCSEEPNVRVLHLGPIDDDPPRVNVSFEHCGLEEKAAVKRFSETGRVLLTSDEYFGKVTSKRYDKGRSMSPLPQEGRLRTHTKSLSAGHFQVDNDFSGKAKVVSTKVLSTEPFKIDIKTEFLINVGGHRAVDVDDSEQLFVIVEEPKTPDAYRKVLLYRRAIADPVCTYTSPLTPFQPSDVCFFPLGGEKMLLVADEANDVIHVVKVEWSGLTFQRFLAPGCPSLVQPTALNVDVQGRLWVACRGGKVITMETTESTSGHVTQT